ncbi:S-layer homology domain-containing protein [Paenibacillus eucommiae]|uniref:S-layer homology domain-containing protein n=1 Tax=Paenibacillus eucommiae TaxID=1355755 RepID=A0ABS4IVF6_9BACL|nr:S-layer homology domain-containing protein [Paenibacillus eucommiae]MBP1990539.1 hypothetical protein [Paenibacillus eucommiae]
MNFVKSKSLLVRFLILLLFFSTLYGFPPQKAAANGAGPTGPELLPNGGFELQTNGHPDEWSQYDSSLSVMVSDEEVYEGNYSIKLVDPSPSAQPGLRSSSVPVTPGSAYQASIFAYVNAVAAMPDMYLEFWDSSGARIQVEIKAAEALDAWHELVIQQVAPANAAYATILLYGSSVYEGTTYLDHASLTQIPQVLLPNGGFELQTSGVPNQWEQLDPSLPVAVTNEKAYEGNYSLKIVDPSPSAQLGLRSSRVPVTPGDAYRASIFAHVTSVTGMPDVYLEFWDVNGARIGIETKTAEATEEWHELVIQQEAPANAAYATVLLYGSSVYEGTAYFDQASLTQIPLTELQQMSNGDFEKVSGGTPSGWTQLTPSVPAVSVTDIVYEGQRSVKLANPTHHAMGLRSPKVPVTPGTNYKSSVQTYIVNGVNEIYVEFWNTEGKRIANYIQSGPLRNQWQELSVETEAPAGAVYVTLLLLSNDAGTSYFDAASIDPIPPEPVRTFPIGVTSHPRLYFTSADIPALRDNAQDTTANPFGQTGQQLWNEVKQKADLYLAETDHFTINFGGGSIVTITLPPTQPGPLTPPEGYASYPFWTQISRDIQNRLETLSLAYVITQDNAYADKAKSYVLSMTNWDTWTDPADECGGSCLDTVHITMGVSTAYDMLYDLFTPAERSQIETALENKALATLFINTLAKLDNNGQIVKAAALAAGASVLHGSNPNTNKYLTRAFNFMKWYLDQRMQSGQSEGFLYTDYSIEALVKAVDQVTRTTGQSDLMNHPFFNDFVIRWANYFLAPGGTGTAAFSDSLYNNYFHNTMNVLKHSLNNDLAGWYLSQAKPASLEIISNFLYFNADGNVVAPSGMPTSAVLPEIGWAALRSGWEKEDVLLAFQSNNFSAGHNHFDQNSFQIATNGSWIARDPGYQDFRRPSDLNDFTVQMGHSTIQVDGQGQSSLGGGTLTQGMLTPTYDYVKGSAAKAYANPKLEKYDRHIVYIKPNYYVMLDDLQADVPRDFDWVMFNGQLFDYQIDGTTAVPGQTQYGNDLFVQNGSAQITAKFLSPDPLPMTFYKFNGAENYGYSVKVGSGDEKLTDHRFLTVMKAGPFVSSYYQAEEMLPAMTTSASSYPILTEVGTRFIRFNMSQVGDYTEYQVNVDEEGDYQFSTTFIDNPNFGNVQVFVDGQPIGSSVNAGSFGYLPKLYNHGTLHFTAGQHTLRYEVIGKNTDEASYNFAIDAFQLLPAGDGAIDSEMQIDAELLQGTNVIGAQIERGDDSTISDTVLFKTGGSNYTVEGIASDADQAVISQMAGGDYAAYDMTRGKTLTDNGTLLLQGSSAFNAAMYKDANTSALQGTLELNAPMSVTLHAASLSQVSVDDNVLLANEYTYDLVNKLLTVTLAAGTHTIEVKPQNVDLSSLIVSSGALNEAFSGSKTSYTQSVANSITSLTVLPEAADETAAVTVNGTSVASGQQSAAIALNVGTNVITVVVTAADESAAKTYTITVTRAGAPNGGDHGSTNSYTQTGTTSTSTKTTAVTVKLNGMDIEVKEAKETSDQGTVTKLSVGADLVTKAFSNSSVITLDINNTDPVVKVELPASALLDAASRQPGATVQIIVDGASYSLPVRVLQDMPTDAVITVTITRVSGKINDAVNAEAHKLGSQQLLEHPFNFRVDINGRELTDFKGVYVARTLTLKSAVDAARGTAVWVDTNNNLHFVPSVFTNKGSGSEATIYSPHNSVYTVIQSDKTFADLNGHWAMADVEMLANKLIVNGVTDNTFAPDNRITRAEFAALLVRSLGLVEVNEETSYTDVAAGDWYAGAVSTAQKAGLISGYEDGTFRPNAGITREQMVTMIVRALKLGGKEVQADVSALGKFSDRDAIADWAQDAVAQAVAAGIIEGIAGATFAPQENATRAQGASMLKRMLQYVQYIN